MIPNNFKDTHQLINKFSELESIEELNILKLEDPDLANQLESIEQSKGDYQLDPQNQIKQQINESFKLEYELIDNHKTYFAGCSYNTYISTYDDRLDAFKETYRDAQEHNFIYDELEVLTYYILPNYIDDKFQKSIRYSLERTKDFLIDKLENLGFIVTFSIDDNGLETLQMKTEKKDLSIKKIDNSALKWKGDITHLVELGMALKASNSINVGKGIENISENKFYELLASFFNIDKLYHEKLKRDIRTRVKDDTVFIPMLDEALKQDFQDRLK